MLNHITVMGRLTRDPELRRTQSGTPVSSFSIACDRDYKDKATGERPTDFLDIVAWRATGEFVSKYFSQGRMEVVSGRLQMRDWTDKEGNPYVYLDGGVVVKLSFADKGETIEDRINSLYLAGA